MILVIDNYDSFTFNLVQYIGELGAEPDVHRNDALRADAIPSRGPRGIIISPGPGRPEDAGVSVDIVRELSGKVPILGVCLGHQAIGFAFGGRIGSAPSLIHGKATMVHHDGSPLFRGVPNPFRGGRYHSLLVMREGLPGDLEVTAHTEDGLIMGLRHKRFPVYGVQFHPESILTEDGKTLLVNFLAECGEIDAPGGA